MRSRRSLIQCVLSALFFGSILATGVTWQDGALLPGLRAPEAQARRARRSARRKPAPGKVSRAPIAPPPMGQALQTTALPDAPSAKRLTASLVQTLPRLRVPAKQIVADLKTHCETAWYADSVRGKKIGYARQLVSRPNKGVVLWRDSEANVHQVAGAHGGAHSRQGSRYKDEEDGGVRAWILENMEVAMTMVFLFLVFGIGGITAFFNALAGSGPGVSRKRKKVGAALAAHLVRKHFVVDDDDAQWDFSEDNEDNQDLDAGDKASMSEVFGNKALFGYVGRHLCMVAATGGRDAQGVTIDVRLYWDNHQTNPAVALELDTQEEDEPPESGMQRFHTGNPRFDGLFLKRHASAHAASRLGAQGAQLGYVEEFVAKYKKNIARIEVGDTLEATFRDRLLLGAARPTQQLDELLADVERLAQVLETTIDPSFVHAPPPAAGAPRYAAVEVITTCPKCKSGVPLNGPMTHLQCPACLSEFSVSPDFWDLLEEPYKSFHSGGGALVINFKTDFRWQAATPKCAHCHAELPVQDSPVGSVTPIRCSACGQPTSTFPAPAWLRDVVPKAAQLYRAERARDDDAPQVALPNPEAPAPVVMSCPQCGGALTVTAEMERIIRCSYCQVEVFLPDALWKRLHPVKTASVWYVRYHPPGAAG